jgi:hypothetical protein
MLLRGICEEFRYGSHASDRLSLLCNDMINMVLSSFMTDHVVCNQSNTTGATSGAGTAYPSGASEFIAGF